MSKKNKPQNPNQNKTNTSLPQISYIPEKEKQIFKDIMHMIPKVQSRIKRYINISNWTND